MKYEKEIDELTGQAMEDKDPDAYIDAVLRTLKYFLKGRISLIQLDTVGASWLPYLSMPDEYKETLGAIANLEVFKGGEQELRIYVRSLLDELQQIHEKRVYRGNHKRKETED